ncbi:MAG: hypothetical protein ACJAVK_002910, partial [Akkermansiaceae bacterium]
MKSQVPEGKGSEVGQVWSPLELAEVETPRRVDSIWRAKGATLRRRITPLSPPSAPVQGRLQSPPAKSKFLAVKFLGVVLMSLSPCLHAEEKRPSVENVLDFLKEKMPESLELLKRVRDEEGEEDYQEVVEGAGDILVEYLEIKGKEAAERFLDEERGRIRMEALLEAWHETDDEAEKKELRKEIGELIGEQIDREIDHGHQELEKLKEEVEKIEDDLVAMEEEREAIIAEELEGILSEEEEEEREE